MIRPLAETGETMDRSHILLFFTATAIVVLGTVDLVFDAPSGLTTAHFVVELLLILTCFGAAVGLGSSWLRTRRDLSRLRTDLHDERIEREAWRARALTLRRGLGEAIDDQLERWSLTPAEKDVAFLLLKGYSHKEIASLSARSERTVRQHGMAVYRKSGLSGRTELSAFFLEDLLQPPQPSAAAD